jgi:hypothetical protein
MSNADSPRASAEELAPLLREAAARRAGVCPGCLAFLPEAVPELPPPLDLEEGRCSGDGFIVEVRGAGWFRTLTVTLPDQKPAVGQRTLTPRGAATISAALVLLATVTLAQSPSIAAAGLCFAAAAYLAVRLMHAASERRDDRLIEVVWRRVAPGLVERESAARFLTRLCLASLGRGDAAKRMKLLGLITARARQRCQDSDAELQLFAAASVLQVQDMAQYGRDVVAGIAALAAEGFVGRFPAHFAEAVVACYCSQAHMPGELVRLRILLLAAAFESGLGPGGLQELWSGAPHLKQTMAPEPLHRLGFLFGLWGLRQVRSWDEVASAETVFELARTSPHRAAHLLAEFPDLLLVQRLEPTVEVLIGPILVCCRGVAVGSVLTADPDTEVQLTSGGRTLVLGRRRLEVAGELPETLVRDLRHWLRYRADVLVPFLDSCQTMGAADILSRVIRPFCQRCLNCGTVSAVSAGVLGRTVTDLASR